MTLIILFIIFLLKMAYDDYLHYKFFLKDLWVHTLITIIYAITKDQDYLLKLLNIFFISFFIGLIYVLNKKYDFIQWGDLWVLWNCWVFLIIYNDHHWFITLKFFLLFFIYNGVLFIIDHKTNKIPAVYIIFWTTLNILVPSIIIKYCLKN